MNEAAESSSGSCQVQETTAITSGVQQLQLPLVAIDSSRYSYKPLEKPTSVRLLSLQPGDGNDELECSLEHTELDTAGAYEAISYAWGEPDFCRQLICDGLVLPITANLELALLRLRRPTESRILWVDAVCVNQEDVRERGHQVRLMERVFSGAQRVVVSLGVDSSGSAPEGFAICKQVEGHVRRVSKEAEYDWSEPRLMHDPELLALPPEESNFWAPLIQLFRCQWFTRLWVVQEVVLSEDATIIWGDEEIPISAVAATAIWLYQYKMVTGIWIDGITNFITIWHLRLAKNYNLKSSLTSLMRATWKFECTDPRDRVYALLALPCSDIDTINAIEPDYTVTPDQLSIKVAQMFFVKNDSLRQLLLVEHGTVLKDWTAGSQPSWAINLDEHGMPPNYVVFDNPSKSADRGLFFSSPLASRISPTCPESVWLQGFIDDEISIPNKSRLLPSRMNDNQIAEYILELWKPIKKTMLANAIGKLFDKYRRDVLHLQLMFVEALTAGGKALDWAPTPPEKMFKHFVKFCLTTPVKKARREWNSMVSSLERSLQLLQSDGEDSDEEANLNVFARSFINNCPGRKIFTILGSNPRIGLGPASAEEGDVVGILCGGAAPFVLRRQSGFYRLVGPAYVTKIMDGQAVESWRDGETAKPLEILEIR
jgi:hypothetical protein